jgi:hypothetical protein
MNSDLTFPITKNSIPFYKNKTGGKTKYLKPSMAMQNSSIEHGNGGYNG